MSSTLLKVDRVSKRFCRDPKASARYALRDVVSDLIVRRRRPYLRQHEFWALKNVTLDLNRGEVVGIIGHNGAGKSTLINLVAGILKPTDGKITLNTDKLVMMSHHGDLNPLQTGIENIKTQLSLYGMTHREVNENVGAAVEFSELGESILAPVGTYSYGMRLRLAFAIYTCLQPDVFVVDEALSGGDLNFRRKFQRFLDGYLSRGGSILLASHELMLIQSMCRRSVLIDNGQIIASGSPTETIHRYHEIESPVQEGETGSHSQVSIAVGDPSQSTSRIYIESVQIEPVHGFVIETGSSAKFTIDCIAKEDLPGCMAFLEINAGDVPIALLGTDVCLKKGRNVITCYAENIPMLAGAYNCCAGFIKLSNGELTGVIGCAPIGQTPIKLIVDGPPDRLTNFARSRKCAFTIPATWHICDKG